MKNNTVCSALLVIALVIHCLAPLSAAQSADDISGHWAEEVLRKWIALGWLSGDGNGNFRPNDSISRAEYITLINKMKHYREIDQTLLDKCGDIDVDKWYYPEVGKALAADYLFGDSEGTLSLEQPILRQEAFAMMARFESLDPNHADPAVLSHAFDGAVVDSWAEPYVVAVVSSGLVTGDNGYLYPLNRITRAETVALLDRVHAGSRVFSFPGTYGPQTGAQPLVYQSVRITAPDVTLRNCIVQQDLEVAGEEPGFLALRGMRVFGAVRCDSGTDEVSISGSDLQELELNTPKVRAVIDGDNNIASVLLSSEHSRVTIGGNTAIVQMVAAAICKLQLDEGIMIEHLSLHASAEVMGGGLPNSTNVYANGVMFDILPPELTTDERVTVQTRPRSPDYATLLLPEPEEEEPEEGEEEVEPFRAVRTVSLDDRFLYMRVHDSRILVKRIQPDNATDQRVSWHSSDDSVARVSQGGRVTAMSAGTAVITVRSPDGSLRDTCTVQVAD